MTLIQNIVLPNRLLLTWQAQNSQERTRFIVGEIINKDEGASLHYLKGTDDFERATKLGFRGHPAFDFKRAKSYMRPLHNTATKEK